MPKATGNRAPPQSRVPGASTSASSATPVDAAFASKETPTAEQDTVSQSDLSTDEESDTDTDYSTAGTATGYTGLQGLLASAQHRRDHTIYKRNHLKLTPEEWTKWELVNGPELEPFVRLRGELDRFKDEEYIKMYVNTMMNNFAKYDPPPPGFEDGSLRAEARHIAVEINSRAAKERFNKIMAKQRKTAAPSLD